LLLAGTLLAVGVALFLRSEQKIEKPVYEASGIKRVSTVKDGNLAVFDGMGWRAQFWNGVNLGATLPGHAPGELAPTKEDYLRWFTEMKEMNVDVIRVYTIPSPEFYKALDEFNPERGEPSNFGALGTSRCRTCGPYQPYRPRRGIGSLPPG